MHKVHRLHEPESLKKNKDEWTRQLLEQIDEKDFKKVSQSYKNKYNQEDVKETLEKMYHELCCYCETRIGIGSYEHIEHLRPKSRKEFHHLAFEWENLHWACQICNNKKSYKWDETNPIVDPVEDDPTKHLKFNIKTCEVQAVTERGKTTKEHTELNREKLVRARRRIRDKAISIIDRVFKTTSEEDEIFYKKYLEDMVAEKEQYCSFVKAIIDTYL